VPDAALASTGYCPVCGRQVPAMDSARLPGLVILDAHLDRWPWFLCIGSGSSAFRRRNR
jgi:hypothetical protein